MLRTEDLHAEINGKLILKGLSLTVNAREVLQQLPMEFAVEA